MSIIIVESGGRMPISMMSMSMNEPQPTMLRSIPVNSGMMLPPSDPMMEEDENENEEDMELPPQFNAPGTIVFFFSVSSYFHNILCTHFLFLFFLVTVLSTTCNQCGYVKRRFIRGRSGK